MEVHPYTPRRVIVLVAAMGAVAVLVAAGVAVGGEGLARLLAAAVAVGALVLTVAGVRALRRQAIVLRPGAIGRRGGWTGRVRWCELADVRLRTLAEHRVLLGGTERNLVLWTEHGGSRGLLAGLATLGLAADDRAQIAGARAAQPGLRPFIVPLGGMRPDSADRVLTATGRP